MKRSWKKAFTKAPAPSLKAPGSWRGHGSDDVLANVGAIDTLAQFLDRVHITYCLLKPYNERDDYPLVESRELLPSFDSDPYEHTDLPGFSLVALNRPLNYFEEVFQFDILHSLIEGDGITQGRHCPLEQTVITQNVNTVLQRLPRHLQHRFEERFHNTDIASLENYPKVLPYLLQLDRGHVMSQDHFGAYHLAGVYAHFPSRLDSELKRFGLRIGKFHLDDNAAYERNRTFVYQFLMELYGFPVASERRTSAALFARRLHKLGEPFLIRVLGQSDRTLTTLYAHPKARHYPRVEKIALVAVDKEQKDVIQRLKDGGYFVDTKKRVVILRVMYRQHKFNPNNVRQDRALSVFAQEVIHPLTGQVLAGVNIIKDSTNMFLRLNDIVRGEYAGRIIFKRNEVVENTDTDDKRLKFLYAWLSKHQRRIISYSDEFYANVVKVMDNYLLNPDNADVFQQHYDLFQEVWRKYSFIQQARKVGHLEDLSNRRIKGEKIDYKTMLERSTDLMHDLKFEVVHYYDELVADVINLGRKMLSDRYIRRNYIETPEDELTDYGHDVRRLYRRLVSLVDDFRAIKKSRGAEGQGLKKAG